MNILLKASLTLALLPGFPAAQEPTASKILENVDNVIYAAKDKTVKMRFVLVDKNGRESARDVDILEKGNDHRLVKFTSPADQKGIGFLSLPGDVMILYLPAFKKTRRIASHVKNGKFAGTDLTYENMEARRYSEQWNPELAGGNDQFYLIKLTAKPGIETEYSSLTVKVKKDNFYPVLVEYFDKSGVHCKTMERNQVEKALDKYWESRETVMTDLKTGHKTKLLLIDAKYDSGLKEELFSERTLMR